MKRDDVFRCYCLGFIKATPCHIHFAFLELGHSLNEHHPQYSNSIIVIRFKCFPCTFTCLFNVALCPKLGLLSTFFNALCKVFFNFLFVANIILVVALSIISMWFYAKGKLYSLSNLFFCNPFVFFLMMWDNLLCAIIFHWFILLIICFCPSVSSVEFSSSGSSSIFQFEFLM